jgi:hypothetical protein
MPGHTHTLTHTQTSIFIGIDMTFPNEMRYCIISLICILISGVENRDYGLVDPLRRPRDTLYLQKLALTSATNDSRSVGIVRPRTQAM